MNILIWNLQTFIKSRINLCTLLHQSQLRAITQSSSMQPLWRLHTCGEVYANKAWNLRKKLRKKIKEKGKSYTKTIIFIIIDVIEILAGHKSKGYSCTSELNSDRMWFSCQHQRPVATSLSLRSQPSQSCAYVSHWIFQGNSRRQEQNCAPDLLITSVGDSFPVLFFTP